MSILSSSRYVISFRSIQTRCFVKAAVRYAKLFLWCVSHYRLRAQLMPVLQVEAYRGEIIMPNRHEDIHGTMFEGHLLASETYVGGHVEALEAGVFRSDIATHFKIEPDAVQKVLDNFS